MAETQTEPSAPQDKKVTLDLPMISIQLHKPEMKMPHVPLPHISKQEMGHAVDVAKSILPPPERVAYYGALGALAVFGVVEWPVAAAIGVGTVIAQRARGNGDADGKPSGTRKPDKPKQDEKAKQDDKPRQDEKAEQGEKESEPKQRTAAKAAEAATAKRKATAVKDALNRQKNAAARTRTS